METLPTLYKKTSGGQIEQWRVWVEADLQRSRGAAVEFDAAVGVIHTEYGHVGGALQTTTDVVSKGKNIGRANETTPLQQAEAEARAKWEKRKARGGYVESMARAQAGEDDAEGGIAPMLAQPEDKGLKKIVYPCDAQRKYNGNRCIAVIAGTGDAPEDPTVTLWSRKRTRILGMPHIEAAYRQAFAGLAAGVQVMLDGELYRHGWSLQKISGYCRKGDTKPGYREISHNVYDIASHAGDWEQRRNYIAALRNHCPTLDQHDCIKFAETVDIGSFDEAKKQHDAWVQEGYEGLIFRNLLGLYEAGKRSYNLVKLKAFKEQEFEIVGVTDGRGKFEGKAVFKCKTDAGKEFDCCSPGTMEDRAEFMRQGDRLIGKHLTVKFFEWSDGGTPLFPVGLVVRDYE